jgi:hypothetical protein
MIIPETSIPGAIIPQVIIPEVITYISVLVEQVVKTFGTSLGHTDVAIIRVKGSIAKPVATSGKSQACLFVAPVYNHPDIIECEDGMVWTNR